MNVAENLFNDAFGWFIENFEAFTFYAERDIVWTLQRRLIETVEHEGQPYRVFNDFPILPGKRRSLSADIAILDGNGSIQLAVEFKYEPSHLRQDILPSKFPVVFWGKEGVGKDVKRVMQFVDDGKTPVACSIFIDEGGYFRHRDPHPGSKWIALPGQRGRFPDLSVLVCRVQ